MDAEGGLGVFGDGPHHVHPIKGLVGVLDAIVQGHFTTDGQHRIPLGGGGGQARDQVGDTRPRRGQADPHLAGHPAHRLGHEGGILLVPAEHQLD